MLAGDDLEKTRKNHGKISQLNLDFGVQVMNAPTSDTLRAMQCGTMASEFEKQLNNPNTYSPLEFEERFALLVDAEWNHRQKNKLNRFINNVRFSLPKACIEDIEYQQQPKVGATKN